MLLILTGKEVRAFKYYWMLRDRLGNIPFENKTFLIWLLNSKYLLPSAEVLHNVLLLKQTWAYCERDGLDFVPRSPDCCPSWQNRTVTVRRQGLTLGSVHSLPQNFCWISAVGILPKFLLSEANCLLVKLLDPLGGLSASRTVSESGLDSPFLNSRSYMCVCEVTFLEYFWYYNCGMCKIPDVRHAPCLKLWFSNTILHLFLMIFPNPLAQRFSGLFVWICKATSVGRFPTDVVTQISFPVLGNSKRITCK